MDYLEVELDDELLVDITADLLTRRQSEHVTRQLRYRPRASQGPQSARRKSGLLDGEEVTELLADSDDVAGLDAVGRDVHALAVHGEVTVTDGLTSSLRVRAKPRRKTTLSGETQG